MTASLESTPLIVGIDPGAQGAIALVSRTRVVIWPIPYTANRAGKDRIDDETTLALAWRIAWLSPAFVVIEKVWGIKGQGAGAAFAFGDGYGALRMAFTAAGYVPELCPANRWQAAAGLLGKGKADSVALARQLWPDQAREFEPVRKERTAKDCEGRAEACLIGRFGHAAPAAPRPKRRAWA